MKVCISDNGSGPPLVETQAPAVISDAADGVETKPFWKRQAAKSYLRFLIAVSGPNYVN